MNWTFFFFPDVLDESINHVIFSFYPGHRALILIGNDPISKSLEFFLGSFIDEPWLTEAN